MNLFNTICMLTGLSFLSTGVGFFMMTTKQKNQSTPFTAYVHRYKEVTKKNGQVVYYPVFRFTEGMRTRVVTYNYSFKQKPYELEDEVEILYHPVDEIAIIKSDKTNRNLIILLLVLSAVLFTLAFNF